MSDAALTALTIVSLTLGVLGAMYGLWRRVRPVVRRLGAGLDALVGREAVTDRAGREIEPAQPGLVHRTTTLEQAVATLVDQDARIKHIEDDHGARIQKLEDARLDRLITQAESAQAWRAIAENAIDDLGSTD